MRIVSEAEMPLPEEVYWANGRGAPRNGDELTHEYAPDFLSA